MESLVKDLRFAFRTLVKSPVITTVALLSLAIGIGANTTIFTMVNAVFIRGLGLANPDGLVQVFTADAKNDNANQFGIRSPVSRLNFEDLRDQSDVFSGLASFIFVGAGLSGTGGEPEQIGGQMVTANYFEVLGVEPMAGRTFLPDEDDPPGAHPVVVLSHRFWSQRFGADPEMVGGRITLNGMPFTVVGIAPPGFRGTFTLGNPSFWATMSMHDVLLTGVLRGWYDNRRAGLTRVFGRLGPGVSEEGALAAIRVIGANLASEYPDTNEARTFGLVSLAESAIPQGLRQNFVRAGGLLMTIVGLVLLVACANVANLLLGRASARRKEIAIRLSLGAGRGRLMRQLMTESVLLAVAGGALGVVLASWGRHALWAFRPPFLQASPLELSLDPNVLLFTGALTLVTGLLFGLVPALQASRPQLVGDLKPQGELAGTKKAFGFRSALVVTQVALSLVALIGSGLFLRSLGNATRIDPGFETERIALMSMNVGSQGYEPARGEQYFDEVLSRARAVPGVEEAALTTNVPLFNGFGIARTVFVIGRDAEAENNGVMTAVGTVGRDYFRTMGVPLLAGRDFESFDELDAPSVVAINQATAARFWPGEDPIGQRFYFHGQEDNVREVVALVKDTKRGSLGESPQPFIYMPRKQNYQAFMNLVLRTSGDTEAVLATTRNELQAIDPNLPIVNVRTMDEVVFTALWGPRMAASLLGILGLLALLLASIGIYGVMSYAVSQRNREIGIRMALGAKRSSVLELFVRQGMRLVLVGAAIGVVVAALASRAIQSLLYDVSPTDFVTFTATTLVLVGVALFANFIPARRATAVDPVRVLKYE